MATVNQSDPIGLSMRRTSEISKGGWEIWLSESDMSGGRRESDGELIVHSHPIRLILSSFKFQ